MVTAAVQPRSRSLAAPDHVPEQPGGEPGGLAGRPGRLGREPGQVILDPGQVGADPGGERGLGPGLELLRRQAARQQVLAQQHHGLFPFGVGDADRPFVHATTVKE